MTPTGKWFACFSVETDVAIPPQKERPVMGIDVGLESFSMHSNGDKTENPRCFRPEENEPARVQRKLSKVHKGPPERNKALKVVERTPCEYC